MEWKRWRHCWQLFVGDKKVGVVACVPWRKSTSQFYVYLKGKRIAPLEHERQYSTGEGAWSSLTRAKRVLEMEAEEIAV